MATNKEIRTRMKSVEQTLKITNAMYLISSSKLRKARQMLSDVQPYFQKITETISDILHHSPEIEHCFFDKRPHKKGAERKVGYVVITVPITITSSNSPSSWSRRHRARLCSRSDSLDAIISSRTA